MYSSEDQIFAALMAANLNEQKARLIAKEAKPCIWLETRSVRGETEIACGKTKIGGEPDLPAGFAWPLRPPYPNADRADRYRRTLDKLAKSGRLPARREELKQMVEIVERPFPLAFVAQINFAEAWGAGTLDPDFPKEGLLSIFYDTIEGPWGFDPADHIGSKVLFHRADLGELDRQKAPADFGKVGRHTPFEPVSCYPRGCHAPLPVRTARFRALGIDKETAELYGDWWSAAGDISASEGGSNWKCHRVGGWPTPVQGDMQAECALVDAGYYCGKSDAYRASETLAARGRAEEWLLLAQIGSDSKARMMWGDNGQLYAWIRREDLVANRFEAARLILQCY